MDRFELENKINHTTNFADQLRSVSKAVLEHNMSEDRLANVLEGLAVLIELHTNETFEVFQQAFRLDNYNENLQTEDD
jgi:NurA-like 5'-3' nuclease